MTKISIVTAMYKDQDYVEEFCARVKNVVNDLGADYEIILVNDKSPDNSLEVALDVHKKDPKVKVIDLSKNFGQHIALLAGLEKATGDYAVTIDIDLEEKPEFIKDLYEKVVNGENDVVFGVRKDVVNSIGGLLQKIYRRIYWFLFSFISDFDLKKNVSNIRVMNRKFYQALISHKERGWSLAMMTQICGFKQDSLPITRIYKNKSSYGFFKRVKFFLSLILNYSNKPLYVAIYVGLMISSTAFLFGTYIILNKILFNVVVDGWSSIMVSIWFLGGAIIFFLGIIGTYIANIFIDVKNRPVYVIEDEYGFND